MKISEIIKDKYKLHIPPTVYYDLLSDVQEAEEEPYEGFKQKAGVVIEQLRADRDRLATALEEIERTITEHAYPVRYDTNSIELGMTLTGIKQAFDMYRKGKE